MSERSCQLTGKKFSVNAPLYEQFGIPLPNVSPEERFRRLVSFKPGKHLFRRICDLTEAKLFSIYSQSAPFPVISAEAWKSPAFDPFSFGQGFDFKRLFMEQLLELWRRVPRPAYTLEQDSHSRLADQVYNAKNSFLIFDSSNVVDCACSTSLLNCDRCVDCYQLSNCSSCYESICLENCTHCHFCEFSTACRDSWFLFDCVNCQECLFCVGLQGKQHHVFNEPVSADEYRRILAESGFHAAPLLDVAKNKFRDFLRSESVGAILKDSVSDGTGNYLRRSLDVDCSFEISDSTHLSNSHDVRSSKNILDSLYVSNSENVVQSVSIRNSARILNSVECSAGKDLNYCSHCTDSEHLFACIGLSQAEYCIFNQQYSKQEFKNLFEQISSHMKQRSIWGVPLPVGFSGHSYNRSAANEYMPLTKVPAKMMGFLWDDDDQVLRPSELLGEMQSPASEMFEDIPEQIDKDKVEKVSRAVYLCTVSGKPFQLSRQEVEFFVAEGIAPPKASFPQRFLERISRITPHELNQAKCSRSGLTIPTAVPPKWKQPVHEIASAKKG